MRNQFNTAAIALVIFTLARPAAAEPMPYTSGHRGYAFVLDQPTPYGCGPMAINDAGQVLANVGAGARGHLNIGFVTGPNGVGTTVLDLGGPVTFATGINSHGQVVGFATKAGFRQRQSAFITDAGGTNIRLVGPEYGDAAGINDIGQVVGSVVVKGNSRAYLTGPNGHGYSLLGTFGGSFTDGLFVNASGQVAGRSTTLTEDGSDGDLHAFVTGPNGVGMTDLSVPGSDYSYPTGLNDLGQVSGTQRFGSPYQQFVTGPNGTDIRLLGTLGNLPGGLSQGGGINNEGIAVGDSSRGSKYSPIRATITGPDGRMRDLNKYIANLPAGVTLVDRAFINNRNQIATRGTDGKCYIVCPDKDCQKPAN